MFYAHRAEFIEVKASVTRFPKLIVDLIEIHKIRLTSGMVYHIHTRCVGKVKLLILCKTFRHKS
jgi:hypothetical protein